MKHSKLDQEAVLANKEEALIIILNESNPSDFLKSKALLSSLRQCIGRGTLKDIQELQHEVSSSSLSATPPLAGTPNSSAVITSAGTPNSPAVSPVVSDVTVPASAAQGGAEIHWQVAASSPSALPSSPPLKDVTLVATQFFQQRVPLGRIGNLNKAVKGFVSAYQSLVLEDVLQTSSGLLVEGASQISTGLVLEGLPKVWSGNSGPFGGHVAGACVEDPFKRIESVLQGRWQLEKSIAHSEFARRLTYVFLAHEADELMRFDHQLRRGKRTATVTFDIIANRLGTRAKVIQKEHYKSKNYKYLLQKGGSGALLLLGSDIRTLWELTLNENDIDILLEFRRLYLPQIERLSRKLDHHVRRTIKLGLTAYGWNCSAIITSDSALMKTLGKEEEEEKRSASALGGGCGIRKRSRGEADSSGSDNQSSSWSGSKRLKGHLQFEDCNRLSCEAPSNTIAEDPINSPEANNGASNLTGAQNLSTESAVDPRVGNQVPTVAPPVLDGNTLDVRYGGNEMLAAAELNGCCQIFPGHNLADFIQSDYPSIPGHNLADFIQSDYPSVNCGDTQDYTAWGLGFVIQDENPWPDAYDPAASTL